MAKCIYSAVDLFCGLGGLSLGLQASGINVLGGMDIWKDAVETYKFNLRHPCTLGDITKLSAEKFLESINADAGDIDIMAGGPPCQGFSTVGKRNESDPRNTLVFKYLEYVKFIKPHYIIIENVGGILISKNGTVVSDMTKAFSKIGYHLKFKELIAANYGVPQLRKRVIFFGWREGLVEPEYPEPFKKAYVTVKDAIFDLPELESGEIARDYIKSPVSQYQTRARKGSKKLYNHEAANHPRELVEILKYIPDGGNRRHIPDHLQPPSGFHNSYARLSSNEPAIAVTSNMRKPSSARCTHPTQNRGLTVREGLRLQSFPDTFIVQGSRTSQYLQVGNAVPPLLAKELGNSILSALNKNQIDKLIAIKRTAIRPLKG